VRPSFGAGPLLLLALAALASCGAPDSSPRALFERTCSRCHGLDVPLRQDFDRTLWEAVVMRMSGFAEERRSGPIPQADQKVIVEYLLQNAGSAPLAAPARSGGKR